MHFALRQPCPHCPFRQDCRPGWLGEQRAREIALSVTTLDQTFPCHETTAFDDEGDPRYSDREQHCAGALLFVAQGGDDPNWRIRFARGLGLYDPAQLRTHIPVFRDVAAMARHHANRRRVGQNRKEKRALARERAGGRYV